MLYSSNVRLKFIMMSLGLRLEVRRIRIRILNCLESRILSLFSVADPDQGSRIRCLFDPGPRSGIPTPYFLELSDNFLGKKFYNSLKTGPNFFLQHKTNYYKFCEICCYKNRFNKFFFTPRFCCFFWIPDPRSVIRNG
jgi:hypothetical protein